MRVTACAPPSPSRPSSATTTASSTATRGARPHEHVVIATAPYHAAGRSTAGMASVVAQDRAPRHMSPSSPAYWPSTHRLTSRADDRDERRLRSVGFDRGAALGGRQTGLVGVVIMPAAPIGRSQEALEIALLEELSHLRPAANAEMGTGHHRKRATFACTPGLSPPDDAHPEPGLWLAGDLHRLRDYPATIESAVASGVLAGRSILKRCGLQKTRCSSRLTLNPPKRPADRRPARSAQPARCRGSPARGSCRIPR